MPSPFPGMNPHLEQRTVWHDFHESFMPLAREIIAAQVRPKYTVKIDEHLYIHELPDQRRLLGRGDVTVARSPRSVERGGVATAAGAAAPLQVDVGGVDFERLSYLEIRDRESDSVVTVLELLSPSNKEPGPDRDQYVGKRARLLSSQTHFVEIDLLRGGPRMPIHHLPDCHYYALVSRADERPKAGLWPLTLRDPLPAIPIPLLASDANATLDLQAVLHRIYDAAGYEDYIYQGEPQPPLSEADVAWVKTLLPSI